MLNVRTGAWVTATSAFLLACAVALPARAQVAAGARYVTAVTVDTHASPGDYRGTYGQCYALIPENPNTTNDPEDRVGPGFFADPGNAARYMVNGQPAQCVTGDPSFLPLVDFELRTENETSSPAGNTDDTLPNEAFIWHYCEPGDDDSNGAFGCRDDLAAKWRVKADVSQYNACLGKPWNGLWDDEGKGPLNLNLEIKKGGKATLAYYFVEGIGECRTMEYKLTINLKEEASGTISGFSDGKYLVFELDLPEPDPAFPHLVALQLTSASVTGCNSPNAIVGGAFIGGPICAPVTPKVPRIDIRKQTEGPDSREFSSGASVPFEIAVTNTGEVDLVNVVVTDALAPGCAKTIGPLPVGGSPVVYTCTSPNVTTGFTNTACVSGSGNGVPVTDCDDSTVKIELRSPGTGTPGYWKNHPTAWPGPVDICGTPYTHAQAVKYMSGDGDKTYTMFRSLISAKLNVAIGNDASCIAATIASADKWLCAPPVGYGPVGSKVAGSSKAWKIGEPLYLKLDAYNNGKLCAPHRD